ncbi:hypothetical protein [Emticicia agri]|nr:hypothetical protein [Emticicia agri]
MRYFFILLVLTVMLIACTKSADEPTPDDNDNTDPTPSTTVKKATGEWIAANDGAGGFTYPESFRNYLFIYEVESNNQLIAYELSSPDIEVAFFLYNSNGERMWQSERGRIVKGEAKLNAGKYYLSVVSERYALGKFELKIGGVKKDIVKVPFEIQKSGEKSWGTNGGGGIAVTPKNHIYTFEVTEDNTYIDIEMESKDTEIGLYLYDTNGQEVERHLGQRRHFIIARLNKGTYAIMAATKVRGSRGNYTLKLLGKVKNLKKHEVSEKVMEGNMASNKDIKTFTFEITEENSLIDLQLTSATLKVGLKLYDSDGQLVGDDGYTSSAILVGRVKKGTYKLIASSNPYVASPSGNFKLVAVGNFK